MGDFRFVVDCVGGHGQDREKKDGEVVDFKQQSGDYRNENTPEAIACRFIEELKKHGCSVQKAKVIHWPTDNYPDGRDPAKQIEDDLITGVRKNQF